MLDYCHKYKISDEQGCQVSLTNYDDDQVKVWCYDYGFGLMRK
jgi:CRISPR-associated endonuclease/helicase Cas3